MALNARFVKAAEEIITAARTMSVDLRLIGSIAFQIHCPKYHHLFSALGRDLTDIDFVALSKQKKKISQLIKGLGYSLRAELLIHEGRYFFVDHDTGRKVDVFFDKLSMCHTINFRNRLTVDPNGMTISLADLLLEKLQIVEINEKDLLDLFVLLLEHDLGPTDVETINTNYLTKLLSDDWGFYYTATTNLNKVVSFVADYEAIGYPEKEIIRTRISSLLETLETAPKSRKWRIRARVGTSRKWYKDVSDADR